MTAKPIPLAWSTVRLIAEDAVRLGLATARLHGDDAGAQAYEGMRDALVTLTATPSAADALLASLGAVPADLAALLTEHAEAVDAIDALSPTNRDLWPVMDAGRRLNEAGRALADWTRAHPSPPAPVPLRAIVEAAYGAGWDERGNRERDVAATGEHGTPKYETRCEAYVLSVLAQAAPHAERMNAEDDPRGYWTDTRARKPGEWNIVDRAPVDATREATLEPATGDGILAAFGEMAKPAIVANNVNRMPGTVWIGETKQPTAPPPTPGPLSDEELTDLRVKVGYLTDSGSLALTERDRGRITFTRADDKARHEVAQFPYTYQAEAVVALVGAADRLFAMAAACAPLEREVARLQSDNSRLTQGVLNFSLTTRVNADMAAEINGLTAEVARLREALAARVTPLTAERLDGAVDLWEKSCNKPLDDSQRAAVRGMLRAVVDHLGAPVALPGVDRAEELANLRANAWCGLLGPMALAWDLREPEMRAHEVEAMRRALASLPRADATSDARPSMLTAMSEVGRLVDLPAPEDKADREAWNVYGNRVREAVKAALHREPSPDFRSLVTDVVVAAFAEGRAYALSGGSDGADRQARVDRLLAAINDRVPPTVNAAPTERFDPLVSARAASLVRSAFNAGRRSAHRADLKGEVDAEERALMDAARADIIDDNMAVPLPVCNCGHVAPCPLAPTERAPGWDRVVRAAVAWRSSPDPDTDMLNETELIAAVDALDATPSPAPGDGAAGVSTFYIASSGDGRADVLALASTLERSGMRNTFAWPDHWWHRCSAKVCGIRDRRDLCAREIEAARTCDLFVGIARLGKGSHVEFGMALTGRARRIILVGVDTTDLVFYEDPRVEHVATWADAARLLDPTIPASPPPMADGPVAIPTPDDCTDYTPAGYSGHWRDWHRGHGCSRDPERVTRAEGPKGGG